MNETNPVEGMLQQFKAGVWEQTEFEKRVLNYLLNNPHRFSLTTLKAGDRIDFIAFYFPRFRKAIEHYQDTGHSFDAYIHRSIQFALRDYKDEELMTHETEKRLWKQSETAHNLEMDADLVDDVDQTYDSESGSITIRNPRQVLVLALKSYRYISPDFSRRIAQALGINPGKLEAYFHEIKIKRAKIDERIDALQGAVQFCYIKKMRYVQQLSNRDLSDLERTKIEWCAAKNLQKLENLLIRLEKIKKSASNQLVAEVLHIPKGTVDANLFTLKQKWKNQQYN